MTNLIDYLDRGNTQQFLFGAAVKKAAALSRRLQQGVYQNVGVNQHVRAGCQAVKRHHRHLEILDVNIFRDPPNFLRAQRQIPAKLIQGA